MLLYPRLAAGHSACEKPGERIAIYIYLRLRPAAVQLRMPPVIEDFEELIRVIRQAPDVWVGAHPLRLPMKMARGVYGGNTIAQTLLVAIELTRSDDGATYIPELFHMYFVKAGNWKIPMTYRVTFASDDDGLARRYIEVVQQDNIISTCLCSLRRPRAKGQPRNPQHEIQRQMTTVSKKYDPRQLSKTYHTGFVRNAYSKEFTDYTACPEEKSLAPSDRWLTVWLGLHNVIDPKYAGREEELKVRVRLEEDESSVFEAGPAEVIPPQYQKLFKEPVYNLIGLANISDLAFLTTQARVNHIPWNPTQDHPVDALDEGKDAGLLITHSLNILQIWHYQAMSLDHHIYFHVDLMEDDDQGFDIVKDWLCFNYSTKRVNNLRALVRGFMYNQKGYCVATVIQEGLTFFNKNAMDERVKL